MGDSDKPVVERPLPQAQVKVKPNLPRLVWLQAPGHSDGVALYSRASLDEATEVSLLALVGNRYALRDL